VSHNFIFTSNLVHKKSPQYGIFSHNEKCQFGGRLSFVKIIVCTFHSGTLIAEVFFKRVVDSYCCVMVAENEV